MTPEQLAAEQREFLIRTEKQSAILLRAEFERMKREFAAYLAKNYASGETSASLANLYTKDFLTRTLLFLDNQIERMSIPFSEIVSRAQRRMINFTGNALKRYLPQLSTSIFEPDKEAIQNLIGRTQDGTSLRKFFNRLRQPIRFQAKAALVEGFALGESSQAIAKRLDDVAGVGKYRALVISRNETVMAYRNASTEFYKDAGISEYRFLSALDPRTCVICWRLHGKKWKLKVKPHIHTQCRCVVVPVLKRDGKFKTGVEHFKTLETGFQKQILGAKRFELFGQGTSLESFVDARKSEDFGQTYFIKNLSDL